jgi:predicted dinucleotide-binding enzyme
LKDLIVKLDSGARAVTVQEAADFGEVVVVSVPFGRFRELPKEGFEGKIVIDTNNYYAGRDGHFEELDGDRTTSSELLQAHLSGARVVKAFNSIFWNILRDLGRPPADPDRIGIPISSDDDEAQRVVAQLMDEIGFDAVDAGTLAEGGRKHQPGSPVYTADLTAEQLRSRLSAVRRLRHTEFIGRWLGARPLEPNG